MLMADGVARALAVYSNGITPMLFFPFFLFFFTILYDDVYTCMHIIIMWTLLLILHYITVL